MKEDLKYWRFAIFVGILFSINCLSTSCVAAFAGKQWPALSGTDQFITIVAIVGNWAGHLMAFCNKTVSRMAAGQLPIIDGNGGGAEALASVAAGKKQQY